jgi:hypothetical protein
MISVFRSIGWEVFRKCNLGNLEEKMQLLAKLEKKDFLNMILFDPDELKHMSNESSQQVFKSRLQLLKEAKHLGQEEGSSSVDYNKSSAELARYTLNQTAQANRRENARKKSQQKVNTSKDTTLSGAASALNKSKTFTHSNINDLGRPHSV